MPVPTFTGINQHLGWGDPGPNGVWFVAIEEGGDQFGQLSAKEQAYFNYPWEPYGRKGGKPCTAFVSEILWPTLNPSQISKEHYKDNVLWKACSKVCFANLYSLPRNTIQATLHLSSFGLANINDYENMVRWYRWPLLRSEHERLSPQVTICLGKGKNGQYWKEFAEVFEITTVPIPLNGGTAFVCVDRGRRFIFANHWSTHNKAQIDLKAVQIGEIQKQLKEWEITVPGVLPVPCEEMSLGMRMAQDHIYIDDDKTAQDFSDSIDQNMQRTLAEMIKAGADKDDIAYFNREMEEAAKATRRIKRS